MAVVIRIQRRPAVANAAGGGGLMQQQQQQQAARGALQGPLTPQEQEVAATQQPAADFDRARQVVLRTQAAAPKNNGNLIGDVPRVFQLDGEEIDSVITKTFMDQFNAAADLINPTAAYRWSEEIRLALGVVLYRFGVWERSQSFGDKMVNLVYRDEAAAVAQGRAHVPSVNSSTVPSKTLKAMHLVLTLLIPYLFRKFERYVLEKDWVNATPATADAPAVAAEWLSPAWKRRIGFVVEKAAAVLAALDLCNFILFLLHGQYRCLADRLLRMRLVHGRQKMARLISLYYLNQHLFWQVLLGFASVVLPMLHLGRVWSTIASLATRPFGGSDAPGASGPEFAPGRRACGYCGVAESVMCLPRRLTPCGHLSCYYCIASRLTASDSGSSVKCRVCDASVSTHVVTTSTATRVE